jgi:transposase
MPSDALPDDLETLKAMLLAEQCESERLRQIIKEMQRHRFGRRAETLPEDQMLLGLEDVEQMAGSLTTMTDLKHMSSAETRVLRAIGQTWVSGLASCLRRSNTFKLESSAFAGA